MYQEWFELDLRKGKIFPGLFLGRDIFQDNCLPYYDRLRTLGYSLKHIQHNFQSKMFRTSLSLSDTEEHVKRSVSHYSIVSAA